MPSVGEKLRSARLDKGLDASQVASDTKISRRYIEAIENDDRQSLPGGFFYKNFVQQYAAYLGMNLTELLSEVERIVSADREPALPGQASDPKVKQFRPPPMNVGGKAAGHRISYSLGLLVAVVLGCSGFYAWWHNSQVLANAVSQVSGALDPKAGDPKPTPVSPTPKQAKSEPAPQEAKSIVPVEPASPGAVPETEPNRSAPVDADQLQIEVAATEQTWLSIAPDGKQVFSGVLQPAEVKTVAARETARIRVGNAGGLEVRLNGKSVGKIGPEGQVRTVIIDRSGVQILEPKPVVPTTPADGPVLNDRAPVAPALNQQ